MFANSLKPNISEAGAEAYREFDVKWGLHLIGWLQIDRLRNWCWCRKFSKGMLFPWMLQVVKGKLPLRLKYQVVTDKYIQCLWERVKNQSQSDRLWSDSQRKYVCFCGRDVRRENWGLGTRIANTERLKSNLESGVRGTYAQKTRNKCAVKLPSSRYRNKEAKVTRLFAQVQQEHTGYTQQDCELHWRQAFSVISRSCTTEDTLQVSSSTSIDSSHHNFFRMSRAFTIALVVSLLMVITHAFGPIGRQIIKNQRVVTVPQRQIRSTTPTMVVYWSIKSAFDLGKYALGGSDKFKGTGVWSFVEFDKGGDKKDTAESTSESQTKSSATKKEKDSDSK